MKNKLYITTCLLILLGATACNHTETEITHDQSGVISISQLISKYMTPKGCLTPVRQNSGNAGLYSVDTIPANGPDIIIRGRIVSDDVAGNIYKNIIIQDEKDPKQGLKISIDAGSASALYPIGQIISIRCNGLAIGKYAEQPQLGIAYFNTDKEVQGSGWKPGTDGAKIGWEIGRIPLPFFKNAVKLIGEPDTAKIFITETTIDQITGSTDYNGICGRIVRLRNVHFNQESDGEDISDSLIFAPTTNGVGYPQSRDIEDDASNTISIATSEYARFAGAPIPPASFKGDIVAIIGWYHDKESKAGSWQLTIRSLDDLNLSSGDSIWKADKSFYPQY